jgi:fermentation-respiration switch protein FrsA (DUF1100 family)
MRRRVRRVRKLTLRRWLWRTFGALTALYLVICGAAFFFQDALLFHPTTLDAADALTPPDLRRIEIPVAGAMLHGVLIPGAGEGPRPTVLYFGGNGEGVRWRVRDRGWVAELGWNLALVSYRGYDDSSGSPSADALLRDAVATFDAVAALPDVDRQRVVAWGNSLGSGLAARVARERNTAGVILSMPYARLSEVASDLYPWLPVFFLFRHEIDTLHDAPTITAPLLVVHGDQDTFIPPDHSRRLVDAWGGPARLTLVPGATHGSLGGRPELRKAIEAFLSSL